MKRIKKTIHWVLLIKVFSLATIIVLFVVLMISVFVVGFQTGWRSASGEYETYLTSLFEKVSTVEVSIEKTPEPTSSPVIQKKVATIGWGGPELWDVVNSTRLSNGVNAMSQKDELCTIAAIRLNETLVLGELDNHAGFSNMPERREDLKWIFDKYVIAEFLVSGADSAQEAVDLWYNTLGHKKLLTGGEYSYGCIYAQDGFAVAIAAYE
jgi:hypothetical protein